jgi:hypothetical protein
MKKVNQFFTYLLVFLTLIVSCKDNDEQWQITGINGRPSRVDLDNGSAIRFAYKQGELYSVVELKSSIFEFQYENQALSSINISPQDKDVADGHASVVFRKEGASKIIAEWSGEPSFDLLRCELELDESGMLTKLTENGVYSHTGANGGLSLVQEGLYYVEFTYQSVTNNLIKLVIHDKSTSRVVETFDYEYDNYLGAASEMGLPLWYYAYNAYSKRHLQTPYDKLLLNYHNNIVRETAVMESVADPIQVSYIYKYNDANVPVRMGNNLPKVSFLTITY